MVFVSGITLSLFLCLLLLVKREKSYSDFILLAWFFFISIHQLLFYFGHSGFTLKHPFFAGVILPIPFVHGPFLFLYVSAMVNAHPAQKKWWHLLHFFPFIVCYLYMIRFFQLPASQRLYIMNHHGVGFETFERIKFWLIIVSGVVYVTLSLVMLHGYQRRIVNRYSNLSKVDLRWLLYLSYGIGLIWLLVIFSNETNVFLTSVVFVALAGFFGIKHVGVFLGNQPRELVQVEQLDLTQQEDIISNSRKTTRYEKSGLTAEKKMKLRDELSQLMMASKPFLNPDLTLDVLASQLHVNVNYLSQFINEELNTTFYDYVNVLRVEEFKRLASQPDSQKFTLLALAYNSGFNSKSSFNRYFKKVVGQSPSTFLRELKSGIEA